MGNLTPRPPLTCPEGTRAERGSDLPKIGMFGECLGIAMSHPSPLDGEGPGVRFYRKLGGG
jgi:hypothetical protein